MKYIRLFSYCKTTPAHGRLRPKWLVIFTLLMFTGYYHIHDSSLVLFNNKETDRQPPMPDHQKLRTERIDRVCRDRGLMTGGAQSVMFVSPSKSHSPLNSTVEGDVNHQEISITSHFHLAPSHRVMGCFVNKIASSSFITTFLTMEGLINSSSLLDLKSHQVHALAHLLLPKV